ncbi:MAG: polysaccharide deacetylase family protein, partial [Bacteroidetes bacterium]|nr:polysaccharide deacetylase family protein [Bacteroidota bacterium]
MNVLGKIKRKIHNLSHPELGVVLMLHRVVDSRSRIAANRELEITANFLEQTILKYQQKGYAFVNLDEVANIIEKGKTK